MLAVLAKSERKKQRKAEKAARLEQAQVRPLGCIVGCWAVIVGHACMDKLLAAWFVSGTSCTLLL